MQTIKGKDLEILEGFKGYGRKDAEIIFIGLEEFGIGYGNLMARIKTPNYDTELLDCKDFHLNRLKTDKLHKKNPKLIQTWRNMSYLMLRLGGKERKEILAKNRRELRKYQRDVLGTTNENGKTLITDLYPIPCQSFDGKNKWGTKEEPYTELIPTYKSKKEYQEKVEGKRIRILHNIINSNKGTAKAIISYGSTRWKIFKKIFPNIHFNKEPLHLKTNSGKSKTYYYAVGELKLNEKLNTKIILTPFFGNGAVSDDFMDELAALIN